MGQLGHPALGGGERSGGAAGRQRDRKGHAVEGRDAGGERLCTDARMAAGQRAERIGLGEQPLFQPGGSTAADRGRRAGILRQEHAERHEGAEDRRRDRHVDCSSTAAGNHGDDDNGRERGSAACDRRSKGFRDTAGHRRKRENFGRRCAADGAGNGEGSELLAGVFAGGWAELPECKSGRRIGLGSKCVCHGQRACERGGRSERRYSEAAG